MLNKNMTQTESLTLTNAVVGTCTCTYINANSVTYVQLDLPISAPVSVTVGQTYFNPAIHKLYIIDGKKKAGNVAYNWYSIQLTPKP